MDSRGPIHQILVIGGGASGMMAAIAAARKGIQVTILERMKRLGKKLLATGNGQCNLTNLNMEHHHYHTNHPDFYPSVYKQFDVKKTLGFFEQLGLIWRSEDQGRIFPATGQASTILDLLRYEIERFQIEVACESEVTHLFKKENYFYVKCRNGRLYRCFKVILAMGGMAAPNLGSNGSGYQIAQQLGHTITPLFPSIVQIRLKPQFLKRLKGIKFRGSVALFRNGEKIGQGTGEILFTDYGLSGIPVLNLSRLVNQYLTSGNSLTIRLDFFPDKSEEELRTMLRSRFELIHYKSIETGLIGLIHKRLIRVVCQECNLNPEDLCGEMKISDIDRLLRILKGWQMNVVGTKSWSEAQVTAGGVDVTEVNSITLESKKMANCFFAGEMLDVVGDCGGYNLQWAWSSGYVAGMQAAITIKPISKDLN